MRNSPGTAQECSPEISPQTDEICDLTYTYAYVNLMWKQAWNNQTVVRLNPAVPVTIYVTSRTLLALTTTDINSWAATVCSTERVRTLSIKSRNASRNKYVAVQKFCYNQVWLSLAINSLATQSQLLQNTATNTKFSGTSEIHTSGFDAVSLWGLPT